MNLTRSLLPDHHLRTFRSTPLLVATGLAVVLALGGTAVATTASHPKTVTVCTTGKGLVRAASRHSTCPRHTHKVTLNRRGRSGPAGPQGAAGEAGASGATGPQGSPGPGVTSLYMNQAAQSTSGAFISTLGTVPGISYVVFCSYDSESSTLALSLHVTTGLYLPTNTGPSYDVEATTTEIDPLNDAGSTPTYIEENGRRTTTELWGVQLAAGHGKSVQISPLIIATGTDHQKVQIAQIWISGWAYANSGSCQVHGQVTPGGPSSTTSTTA